MCLHLKNVPNAMGTPALPQQLLDIQYISNWDAPAVSHLALMHLACTVYPMLSAQEICI